jgi:hypothetical protein
MTLTYAPRGRYAHLAVPIVSFCGWPEPARSWSGDGSEAMLRSLTARGRRDRRWRDGEWVTAWGWLPRPTNYPQPQ